MSEEDPENEFCVWVCFTNKTIKPIHTAYNIIKKIDNYCIKCKKFKHKDNIIEDLNELKNTILTLEQHKHCAWMLK